MNIQSMIDQSKRLKARCLKMAYEGKGHLLKSSLTVTDILAAVYFSDILRRNSCDRVILSKGHGIAALYALMANPSDFESYNKECSTLPGLPEMYQCPYLKFASASLGHGLGYAAGQVWADGQRGAYHRTVVIMGDGECQEGSVWEAIRFIGEHKLPILIIVDRNGMSSIENKLDSDHLGLAFDSFGTSVHEYVSEFSSLISCINLAYSTPRSSVILYSSKTGISFMDDVLWHYRTPSKEDYEKAMRELYPEKEWKELADAANACLNNL